MATQVRGANSHPKIYVHIELHSKAYSYTNLCLYTKYFSIVSKIRQLIIIFNYTSQDATDKLKMSDSSSIHTIEEISHHYVSSRDASAIRSISDSKATEDITPRSLKSMNEEGNTRSLNGPLSPHRRGDN